MYNLLSFVCLFGGVIVLYWAIAKMRDKNSFFVSAGFLSIAWLLVRFGFPLTVEFATAAGNEYRPFAQMVPLVEWVSSILYIVSMLCVFAWGAYEATQKDTEVTATGYHDKSGAGFQGEYFAVLSLLALVFGYWLWLLLPGIEVALRDVKPERTPIQQLVTLAAEIDAQRKENYLAANFDPFTLTLYKEELSLAEQAKWRQEVQQRLQREAGATATPPTVEDIVKLVYEGERNKLHVFVGFTIKEQPGKKGSTLVEYDLQSAGGLEQWVDKTLLPTVRLLRSQLPQQATQATPQNPTTPSTNAPAGSALPPSSTGGVLIN